MREYKKFDIVTIKSDICDFPAIVLEVVEAQKDANTYTQELLLYCKTGLLKAVTTQYYNTFYIYNNDGEFVDIDIDEWETDLEITSIVCSFSECNNLLSNFK